jgi:hypothetical protein
MDRCIGFRTAFFFGHERTLYSKMTAYDSQNSHSSSLQEIVAFFTLDLSKNPRRWVLAHFFPLASHDNFLGAVPSLYVFVCSLLVVLITSDGWFSEAFCLQFLAMFHCR